MPKGIDFNDVMNIFLSIEGVKRVHNLRIWALSLDKIALSAHIAISKCFRSFSIFKNRPLKIDGVHFNKSYW